MMKNLLTLASFLLSLVMVSYLIEVPSYASEEEEILILIEKAQTPEDHMKIAEYYEKEAAKMEELAEEHKSMGESYKNRSKPWLSMVSNCEKLSQEYSDAANEYKSMAQEHEKMAQEMQQQK
jgi:hypothetical protein